VSRARCVVAEAEVALASRELGWDAEALDAARAALEAHGDRVNAAHARNLEVRRLLLIGRLDEAERTLAGLDPTLLLPPASKAAHELVKAGIAIRRLQTKAARAALTLAEHAARQADIPALTAEVESASLVMTTTAARLIARGGRSAAGVRDARCRRMPQCRAGRKAGGLAGRRARYYSRFSALWPKPGPQTCRGARSSHKLSGPSTSMNRIAHGYGSRWGVFARSFGRWQT
jgi:hypothetical protein